ncbi:MAG: GntR family transcriptional regulator [Actinomycetota bacterium]|nr:GntR family transcriptional regulator [Actinomycetota bacterium]
MTSDQAAPPQYQKIAIHLGEMIKNGEYQAGDRLPSESAVMAQFAVSRGTARQALAVLQAQGLAQAAVGRGVFVREQRPSRRIASDRYQHEVRQILSGGVSPDEPATSFAKDHRIGLDEYRLDKKFQELQSNDELAKLFGVNAGEPVLERRFVFYAKDTPQQLSSSYILLKLVGGTPVANPANEPWPGGNIAQLATLGIIVSRVEESVAARMPVPEEATILQIPTGVPVLTIARRMLAGPDRDEVVEVANIVIPADRIVLDYTINLDVWPDPVRTLYTSGGRATGR